MTAKLMIDLKNEQRLLRELIELSKVHQNSLTKIDITELSSIPSFQEELEINLNAAEEHRIQLLMNWLNIPRYEAVNLRLSSIERNIKSEELFEIRRMKNELLELHSLVTGL